MKIEAAIAYFKTEAELARRLGFRSQSTIGNWKRQGLENVPELYARRLHEMTRGRLKFDRSEYEKRIAS